MNRSRYLAAGLAAQLVFLPALSAAQRQAKSDVELQAMLSRYEQTGEGLDELSRHEAITTELLVRLKDRRSERREAALDLLGRLDLVGDGIVNRAVTIAAMLDVCEAPVVQDLEIDIALRYLERASPKSSSARLRSVLLKLLQAGHPKAARALGRVGTAETRMILEPYTMSNDAALATASKVALARLGDEKRLADVLDELKSEDVRTKAEAFGKLEYIAAPVTVPPIASFLDDLGPIASSSHILLTPYRVLAARALAEIVADPPVINKPRHLYSDVEVEIWRSWWRLHQGEYRNGLQPPG